MPPQPPGLISFDDWDARYEQLVADGLAQPSYGGPLRRHLADGDLRLPRLQYDNSPAALRLWNFLLTEEARLHQARRDGHKIVGTMKDLGTVPVLAYSAGNLRAFYPDGAWWAPCVMELSSGVLAAADALGLDDSFCPVRAMIGAFANEAHWPIPDLLTCSVGATCDDFSAIAQRLEPLGHPVLWWEIPHRRTPSPAEEAVALPGGFAAPRDQVAFVRTQMAMLRDALADLAGETLDEPALRRGIARANEIRRLLAALRDLAFTASPCPMPALEMQIAEMLALHFCSDPHECRLVLTDLLTETRNRVQAGLGVLSPHAVPVFWVNPVADLQAMNLLEQCGGRVCGTDYMFGHALAEIPEDIEPLEALAMTALGDPMAGSAADRAQAIARQIRRYAPRAVVISRIPGASHCATEGRVITQILRGLFDIPVIEVEVPPLSDSLRPSLTTRLQAVIETAREATPT